MVQGAASSLAEDAQASIAGLVAGLSQFEGSPGQFLNALVEMQCLVVDARGGAILGVNAEAGGKRLRILAVHPPLARDEAAPLWLAQSSEMAPQVLSSGETRIGRASCRERV